MFIGGYKNRLNNYKIVLWGSSDFSRVKFIRISDIQDSGGTELETTSHCYNKFIDSSFGSKFV